MFVKTKDCQLQTKFAVFTVRYSLFSRNLARSWRIGRGSEADHLNRLFDPERLNFRQHTFANITVPSVASAIERCPEIYFEMHVLASTLLPPQHQGFLRDLETRYPFLRVYFQRPEEASVGAETERFCEELPDGLPVASIRIDDDDAVSRDYLEQLSDYIAPEMSGRLVSLCSGYSALALEDGRLFGPFPYKWRFGSVGLALIRLGGTAQGPSSVFAAGDHTRVDDRAPTLLDARKPAFFRLHHDQSDTQARAAFGPRDVCPEASERFAIANDMWANAEDLPTHHRARLAWWMDYADYRAHVALSRVRFLGDGFRARFNKKAEKRWRPSYERTTR